MDPRFSNYSTATMRLCGLRSFSSPFLGIGPAAGLPTLTPGMAPGAVGEGLAPSYGAMVPQAPGGWVPQSPGGWVPQSPGGWVPPAPGGWVQPSPMGLGPVRGLFLLKETLTFRVE